MAELHSNLYFKHPDANIHQQLHLLFSISDLNSEERLQNRQEFSVRFLKLAAAISPLNGEQLAGRLLETLEHEHLDWFGSESIWSESGYIVSHWVNGSSGDAIQHELMTFLYALCPDIHAQSWGCGDDDPWEYWFKFDRGQVMRFDDEPLSDDEYDGELLATVYRWWHADMPKSVKQGFLNGEPDEEEQEDQVQQKIVPAQLSEEEYQDWLDELFEHNQRCESDDEDDPYEEQEVEQIGPELTDMQSAEIKNICVQALEANNAQLKDYLAKFSPICECLVALEAQFESGMSIDLSNIKEFEKLGDKQLKYIQNSNINPFFCQFLENTIRRIHDSDLLGTMIGYFDNAVYLCAIFSELLQDKEATDILCQSIESYEDFAAWKDFMLMMLEEDGDVE